LSRLRGLPARHSPKRKSNAQIGTMSVAANRYATALIDVLEPDQAEEGFQQLQSFAALFKEQPDSRRFLQNPAMAGERRTRVLNEILAALGLDRRVRNFISVLANRNRLPILEEILVEYQRLMDKRLGIVRARVTAAQPLDSAQQQDVARKLQEITGKQVRMEVAIDPALIGGVVAQVGSTIYDGSVRQQLQAFKNRLVGD
jgi:F-type H+-transporting ATPase subunit delta